MWGARRTFFLSKKLFQWLLSLEKEDRENWFQLVLNKLSPPWSSELQYCFKWNRYTATVNTHLSGVETYHKAIVKLTFYSDCNKSKPLSNHPIMMMMMMIYTQFTFMRFRFPFFDNWSCFVHISLKRIKLKLPDWSNLKEKTPNVSWIHYTHLPVMAAIAVRKKIISIGHISPCFRLQSLQFFYVID